MQPTSPVWMTKERLDFLNDNGYLVIPNVTTPEFCAQVKAGLLEFIKAWDPKLTPDNPAAWVADNIPAGTIHGINRFAGQTQAQWDVRQHPNVAACFAEYWNVRPQDLVTSFDGFNFILAASVKRANGCWGHTDHGATSAGQEPLDGRCLQGLLNIEDCTGDNDGGLVVWRHGHRAWLGHFQKNPSAKTEDNWYKYPEAYLAEIEKDGKAYLQPNDPAKNLPGPFPMDRVRVRAPAGALVVWFSKTPHQNDSPFRRNQAAPAPKDRVAVYVCQAPRRHLTPRDVKRREKAFKEFRQTSHWPCANQVKFLNPNMRTFSKEKYDALKVKITKFKSHKVMTKKPVLTELGKQLRGF